MDRLVRLTIQPFHFHGMDLNAVHLIVQRPSLGGEEVGLRKHHKGASILQRKGFFSQGCIKQFHLVGLSGFLSFPEDGVHPGIPDSAACKTHNVPVLVQDIFIAVM